MAGRSLNGDGAGSGLPLSTVQPDEQSYAGRDQRGPERAELDPGRHLDLVPEFRVRRAGVLRHLRMQYQLAAFGRENA